MKFIVVIILSMITDLARLVVTEIPLSVPSGDHYVPCVSNVKAQSDYWLWIMLAASALLLNQLHIVSMYQWDSQWIIEQIKKNQTNKYNQ